MRKNYQKPETILIHSTIEHHILAGSGAKVKTDNIQHIGQETFDGSTNTKKEEGSMGYTDGTGGFIQGTKPNYWDI